MDDEVRTPLTDADGAVIAELGHVAMNLYLRKDALPYDGQFQLSFSGVTLPAGPSQADVVLVVALPTTTTLLLSPAGTTLDGDGTAQVRVAGAQGLNPPACTSTPRLGTRVQVVNAIGSVDPFALTIDRSFARRIVVSFDWTDLGCRLGSVRGAVTLTFTTANFGFNCNDAFRFVGDAGSRPPFVEPADGGGADAN